VPEKTEYTVDVNDRSIPVPSARLRLPSWILVMNLVCHLMQAENVLEPSTDDYHLLSSRSLDG